MNVVSRLVLRIVTWTEHYVPQSHAGPVDSAYGIKKSIFARSIFNALFVLRPV